MAVAASDASPVAPALAAMISDDTGADTFRRYKWQAKQAVACWLTCLESGADRPIAIVCEHVEDLVVVYPDRLVFVQLKTKERGSWSDSSVCDAGHGIDSLIRSYKVVATSPAAAVSTYELWLEGSAAATRTTTSFFEDPTTATPAVRSRIKGLGLVVSSHEDFLVRLRVRPQQPSRAHIDAVILQHIGALWPAMNTPEREAIYKKLLDCAEDAQAHQLDGARLASGLLDELFPPSEPGDAATGLASMQKHCLTRDMILRLVPPIAGASSEEVLARLREGRPSSALELKMLAAGARAKTVLAAQGLRAGSEIQRQQILASRDDGEEALDGLEQKLLGFARAHATSARIASSGNAITAAMPAEHVFAEIRKDPSGLVTLDSKGLFGGNPDDIFGFLCHISDACKFGWRDE
jgi:hypothetical protein